MVQPIIPAANNPAASEALRQMAPNEKTSSLIASAKIAALFDGAAQPAPIPVPVKPNISPAPSQKDSGDSHLTLPENDLLDEIGVGNY
ncbi:MAG: hypothetical protein WC881_04310 [Elusimicrobiota bacterium]